MLKIAIMLVSSLTLLHRAYLPVHFTAGTSYHGYPPPKRPISTASRHRSPLVYTSLPLYLCSIQLFTHCSHSQLPPPSQSAPNSTGKQRNQSLVAIVVGMTVIYLALKWLCDPALGCPKLIPQAHLGYLTMPPRPARQLQNMFAPILPASSALRCRFRFSLLHHG